MVQLLVYTFWAKKILILWHRIVNSCLNTHAAVQTLQRKKRSLVRRDVFLHFLGRAKMSTSSRHKMTSPMKIAFFSTPLQKAEPKQCRTDSECSLNILLIYRYDCTLRPCRIRIWIFIYALRSNGKWQSSLVHIAICRQRSVTTVSRWTQCPDTRSRCSYVIGVTVMIRRHVGGILNMNIVRATMTIFIPLLFADHGV